MVASLMSVLSARCAQPGISATRARLAPIAAKVWPSSLRLTGGISLGAIASMARRRGSGSKAENGRATLAASSASRKRR